MKKAYDYIYTISIINIVFKITIKHPTYSKGLLSSIIRNSMFLRYGIMKQRYECEWGNNTTKEKQIGKSNCPFTEREG